MKIRTFVVALGCLAAIPVAAEAAQCPEKEHAEYLQFVRIGTANGDKNYAMMLVLPAANRGKQYEGLMPDPNNPSYLISCDCPATHQDCDQTPYDHVHYTHSLPLPGYFVGDSSKTLFNVTEASAVAFWDNQYAGYQKQGGLSYSSNCYGYSFGLGTFVMGHPQTGMSVVLGRCFEGTHLQMGDAQLAVSDAGHAITIEALQDCVINAGHPPEKRLAETTEKNRDSPIYRLQGGCPGVELKAHFGPVENFNNGDPVPLAPYALYKKKP